MPSKRYIQTPEGYLDTPMLPGSRWRVHDAARPKPRVVSPGVRAGEPPSDALVLFDGRDASQWTGPHGAEIAWRIRDGYMETVGRAGSIYTREHFGDCQLHAEWASPAEVSGEGQGRGNSGVFLLGLYEIQVLDSYENPTYADGLCAAIYGQYPPLVNACRKPGEWQTFDVFFLAPRFRGSKLEQPAYMTVIHNGVLVHLHRALMGPTGHTIVPSYDQPHGPTGPIVLQDHGDPVRYRNIWVRPIEVDRGA